MMRSRRGLILPSRRRFLFGAGALLAAPAIVRVASLMPVSVQEGTYVARRWLPYGATLTGPGALHLVVSQAMFDLLGEEQQSPRLLISTPLPEALTTR